MEEPVVSDSISGGYVIPLTIPASNPSSTSNPHPTTNPIGEKDSSEKTSEIPKSDVHDESQT